MCKFKLFSIAAAALMMVACSNEDLTQQTQTKAGKMQFSATIAAPSSGATTRTIYTEDTQNKKITVAWKVGDEIALVHNKVKDVATVKTINADGSATITGNVTGATNNANVRLVYPAARVGTVTGGADGTEYTADETVEGKLKTQGGTLAYIQDNLDFREDMGKLAVNGTEVTLEDKAGDISPLLAIWKLTLSDGTNNLSATQVKIKGGESVLASTTTLTSGTSVVTLAIPNVAIDGALTIEATVGSDTYTYTKAEGPTFNPRTYYQSTVTMTKKIPATVTTAPTATEGNIIVGSTTALVTGGVVSGGTLMYAVTTAKTKPTTTEGFSATVPTAEGRTVTTYYVWYYVKGDAMHTDSEIAGPIAVSVVGIPLNLTNPAKNQLICDNGKNYAYGSVPSGVTPVAKICYVGSVNGSSKVLALALTDDSDVAMKWGDANPIVVAHQPTFTGGTWSLPTKDEWLAMRGNTSDYASLRDGFASVGGTNMTSTFYWGASYNDGMAYRLCLDGSQSSAGMVGSTSKNNSSRTRSCLVVALTQQ